MHSDTTRAAMQGGDFEHLFLDGEHSKKFTSLVLWAGMPSTTSRVEAEQ